MKKEELMIMSDSEILELCDELGISFGFFTDDVDELVDMINTRLTRKEFDRKISEIMEKYDYVDIDEGSLEAVTEAKAGTVWLYREDGRVDTWFYVVESYEENRVKVYRMDDFESEMHIGR